MRFFTFFLSLCAPAANSFLPMTCEIIKDLERIPESLRGCVMAAGNFDGVHMGHQRILSIAAGVAQSHDAELCVLTFDPPPAVVLAPEKAPKYIMSADVKFRLLAQCRADAVAVVKTTPEFLAMSAQEFIRDVLVGRFAPRHMVEGPDFFFGRQREGNVEMLREFAGRFGFDVTVVNPLEISLPGRSEQRISSSLVRDLIRAGDIDSAALCMGRHFTLYGTVVAGMGHGRLLDFPTANVDPNGLISPGAGVYAAWTDVDGRRYPSAVSVGTKPTFRTSSPKTVEVHLLDADDDFYGRNMAITFLARLRDQQKFSDTEALKAQITKDVQSAREMLR